MGLSLLLLMVSAASAYAGGARAGRVVGVEHEVVSGGAVPGTLQVRIRGTQEPTFTVYKLDYPARVVVDMAGAVLDRGLTGEDARKATWSVNEWAVGQISVYELHGVSADDGARGDAKSLVRVVIGMARPGSYQARAHGRDVIVTMTPQEPATPGVSSDDASKMAKAVKQAEARHQEMMTAIAAAEREKATTERERQRIASALAEAKAAQADAERAAEVAERRAKEARALREREEHAYREVAKARAEAEQRAEEASALRAREERVYRQALQARAEAEKQAQASSAAAARLSELEAEVKAARAEAAAMRRAAHEAEQRAAAVDSRKNASDREVGKARAEAERLSRARQQAEQALAARKRDVAAQKRAADTLAKARDKAQAELKELDASAASARQAREAEERRIAALGARRAELEETLTAVRVELKEARDARKSARSEAQAELRALSAAADKARGKRLSEEAALTELSERRAALEGEIAALRDSARTAKQSQVELRSLDAAAARARRERAQEEARLDELAKQRKALEAQIVTARRKAQAAARAEQAAQQSEASAELRALDQAAAKARQARASEESKVAQLSQKRAALANELEQIQAQVAAATAAEQRARAGKAEAEAELRDLDRAAAKAREARAAEESKLAELGRQREALGADLARLRRAKSSRSEEDAKARQRAEAELAELDQATAKARRAQAAEEAKLAELGQQRAALEAELAKARAGMKTQASAQPAKKKISGKRTAVQVRDVDFVDREQAARVIIALASDAEPRIVASEGSRAVLEIDDVDLPSKLRRTLDTTAYRGPIRSVSSYRHPDEPSKMRLVVDLAYPAEHALKRKGSTYYWDFAKSAQRARAARKGGVGQAHASAGRASRSAPSRSPRTRSIPAPVVGSYGAASTPITQKTVAQLARKRRKVYRGTKIDLDLKDVDIHNVMRLLADVGGINIVIPEDVQARVTVRLRQVPWDQALEVILSSKGLWYEAQGNLYRIATRKQLDAEAKEEAERVAALIRSESPEPQVFTLNYAVASELVKQVGALISPKGSIEVDARTNSIIVNDLSENRRRIIELVRSLDTQTPQIQIEARIVEARSTFARELGVQWGGSLRNANTGLVFPNDVSLIGGNVDQNTAATGVNAASPDFAVNLPAAVGTGSGGALGLALGSLNGGLNLTLRLSALENSGTVRIISAPRITVINNVEAEISQGVSIPISVISAQGVQTQFVPADLSLKVKPHVSQRDCSIAMELEVEKNEADFVNTGARGDPTILRKEARTTVLVADNETTVIGGIYTRNSGLSYSKVPFFGDLPLLGWFFKNRSENDERTEVLVFITPRITNKAFLRCDPAGE
ncbi:MAG: hypothetical protein Tsb0020_30070 [Haliangiales bacterium]